MKAHDEWILVWRVRGDVVEGEGRGGARGEEKGVRRVEREGGYGGLR